MEAINVFLAVGILGLLLAVVFYFMSGNKSAEKAAEAKKPRVMEDPLDCAIRSSIAQIEKEGKQNVFWEANCVCLYHSGSTWDGEEYYYNPIADLIWYQSYTIHLDDGRDCSAPHIETEEEMLEYIQKKGRDIEEIKAELNRCRTVAAPFRKQLSI